MQDRKLKCALLGSKGIKNGLSGNTLQGDGMYESLYPCFGTQVSLGTGLPVPFLPSVPGDPMPLYPSPDADSDKQQHSTVQLKVYSGSIEWASPRDKPAANLAFMVPSYSAHGFVTSPEVRRTQERAQKLSQNREFEAKCLKLGRYKWGSV